MSIIKIDLFLANPEDNPLKDKKEEDRETIASKNWVDTV